MFIVSALSCIALLHPASFDHASQRVKTAFGNRLWGQQAVSGPALRLRATPRTDCHCGWVNVWHLSHLWRDRKVWSFRILSSLEKNEKRHDHTSLFSIVTWPKLFVFLTLYKFLWAVDSRLKLEAPLKRPGNFPRLILATLAKMLTLIHVHLNLKIPSFIYPLSSPIHELSHFLREDDETCLCQ